MKITESRLRRIIRSVIRESMEGLPSGNLFDQILQMEPSIKHDLIDDLNDIELSERLSEISDFFTDPTTRKFGKYFGIAMLVLCNLIGAAEGGHNANLINSYEQQVKQAIASGDQVALYDVQAKIKRALESDNPNNNIGNDLPEAAFNFAAQLAGWPAEKIVTKMGLSKYMKKYIKQENL